MPICRWASESRHLVICLAWHPKKDSDSRRFLYWCLYTPLVFRYLEKICFEVFSRLCAQVCISLAEVLERKKQGESWVYSLPPGVLYEANRHWQMKIKERTNNPASDNCTAGLILMKSATYIYISHNDSCLLAFHVICSDGFGMTQPLFYHRLCPTLKRSSAAHATLTMTPSWSSGTSSPRQMHYVALLILPEKPGMIF